MTTPHDLTADPLYAVACDAPGANSPRLMTSFGTWDHDALRPGEPGELLAPIYDTAEAAQAVADGHKRAARDRRDFARSHFYTVRLWPGTDLGDGRVTVDSGYADRIERRYRRNRLSEAAGRGEVLPFYSDHVEHGDAPFWHVESLGTPFRATEAEKALRAGRLA